jgi:hypothetical protein
MAKRRLKIVLDPCVPSPLRHAITGHDVFTSHYLGLSRLGDTKLLDSIEGKFDILLTCDRNIPWQQNFARKNIAIVVLSANTNKLQDLLELVPKLLSVLDWVKPGQVIEVLL